MSESIKIRARAMHGETEVRALILHPMETGTRKDQYTGEVYPAHFIQKVTAKHNGKTIFRAYWGAAVSRDPYVSFQFEGGQPGDELQISWVDNKGQSDSLIDKIR